MTSTGSATRGWIVTLAGLGINLALGVLYSWSVIAKTLSKPLAEGGWGWSTGQASLPYAVAVGVFAISMVFAGRAQDRFGPRIVATIGGALCGAGLILSSFGSAGNPLPVTIGFGALTGLGIGLGYASATPAAVKWFSAKRAGFISGLVVAGFGLASVYIAPLTTWLLQTQEINGSFRILGIAFLITTVLLAQLLTNPPKGYVPADAEIGSASATPPAVRDYTPGEMVRTRQFALMWWMYAFATFAGLMIIGHMAKIAGQQMPGVELGFLLVAVLAIGNALGRIATGWAADRLGQVTVMRAVFIGQAVMMGLLAVSHSAFSLIPVAAGIGFFYGANLALFPSTTTKYFGKKNLGVNYGLVFTAYGFGGVFGSMVAGTIVDATGTYLMAYAIAAALCLAATVLSIFLHAPETDVVREELTGLYPAPDTGR